MDIEEFRDLRAAVDLDDLDTEAYKRWETLMLRCYLYKPNRYKGHTVCEEWHDFDTFKGWFNRNHFYGAREYIWDSKVFSPESYSFVSALLLGIIEKPDMPYLWEGKYRVMLSTTDLNQILIGDYDTSEAATRVKDLMKNGLVGWLRTLGDY